MMIAQVLSCCRICGSKELRLNKRLPSRIPGGGMVSFFECLHCGSVLDASTATADYTPQGEEAFNTWPHHRYYLEILGGIFFISRLAHLLHTAALRQRGSSQKRFLDVGAGVGIATDIARYLGWNATAVEPSDAGRVGEELLGIHVINSHLEKGMLPERSFDLVCSSEVIEHVADPDAFVQLIEHYLADEGIALLTTPNAHALTDSSLQEAECVDAYAAGFHHNLFSAQALERVLLRNGFAEVRTMTCEGTSRQKRLIVMACRQKGILPADLATLDDSEAVHQLTTEYLESVVRGREQADRRDEWYYGASFRLFEHHVNAGRFAEAAPYAEKIDALLRDRQLTHPFLQAFEASNLVDYIDQVPSFISAYAFYRGIFELCHKQNSTEAVTWFRTAHALSLQHERVGYALSANVSWPSRFYEGVAMFKAGQRKEAVAVFESLIAQRDRLPEALLQQSRLQKATAWLELGQSDAAINDFVEIVLNQTDLVKPELREPLRWLVRAGLQRFHDFQRDVTDHEHFIEQLTNRLSDRLSSQIAERLSERLVAHAVGEVSRLSKTERVGRVYHRGMDAVRRAQELFERGRGPAAAMAGRAMKLLAAVEEAARVTQSALRTVHRGYRAVRSVATFPLRVWRRGRRAIGLRMPRLRLCDVAWTMATDPEGRVPVGELTSDIILEQTVVSAHDRLNSVEWKFAAFQRVNRCSVRIEVLDQQGQVVGEASVSAEDLQDNQPCVMRFPPITEAKGKTFRLRLFSPDGCKGNAVAVYARPTTSPAALTYRGKPVVDGELFHELGYVGGPAATGRGSSLRDLLIVTPDRLAGIRIGLAMRHWEIAQTLTRLGLRVTLASVQPLGMDVPKTDFPVEEFTRTNTKILDIVKNHAAILVQGNVLDDLPVLAQAGRPIVADMVTPIHVENIQTSQANYLGALAVIRDCLTKADFFICGNERQRLYWLGMLTALGRISKDQRDRDAEFRRLIDVVGFGIPDDEPVADRRILKDVIPGIRQGDFVLTWFGGIWNWLDPLPLVRAVHLAYQTDPRIKLFFSMYRKPQEEPTAMAARTRQVAAELGALDTSVFFNDLPIPFEQRAACLLESDLGVILQAPNFETQLSARTRALDYFWADLPLLINRGDEIAELVEQHRLGVLLPSTDPAEIARSLLEYVRDDRRQQQTIENIRQMKSRFRWSQTVQPLARFCRELQGKAGAEAS